MGAVMMIDLPYKFAVKIGQVGVCLFVCFTFIFFFLLYNTVLVLPYIVL